MRKKGARKDRRHQNYLKRKASGKQKEYEERTKAKKEVQIESQKEQIRAEGGQHRAEGTGKTDDVGDKCRLVTKMIAKFSK